MTKQDIIDVDDVEAAPEATDKQLGTISRLVRLELELAGKVEQAKLALQQAQAAYRQVVEVSLPEALDAAGYTAPSKFMLAGAQIEYETFVTASITEENRPLAHAWLRDNGHGDLIKREAKFAFPRGSDAFFKKLMAAYRALQKDPKLKKFSVKMSDKEGVHYQTLGAFVRAEYAHGRTVPAELFGVHAGRSATAKPAAAPGE